MNIVHVIQRPQRRGAELFAQQLSGWLRTRGDDSSLVALYDGPHTELIGPNDVVIRGDESSVFEKIVHPRTLSAMTMAIAARNPDVVVVHGARSVKYGAALARLWRGRRWKLVYRNIDSPLFWVRGRLRRFAYARGVMSAMDGVVAISRQTRDELVSLGVHGARSTVIANAVDIDRLEQRVPRDDRRRTLGVLEHELLLAFVGALGPQKRPDRFVDVIVALRQRGLPVRGVIVGDGAWSGSVSAALRHAGLTECVAMLGNVADVASTLAAADILVSCSDTEGMPGVLLEAGALAVPIVAFDVGGVRECVDDGVDGILVRRGDVASLVEAVGLLGGDPERRRRFGAAARARVHSRHTFQHVGAAYRTFFEHICGLR